MAKKKKYFIYREQPTKCPKCGKGKWKTVTKDDIYKCRQCGYTRKNK